MGIKVNNRKEVLSWALYDWANSAFATTIIAGFFPVFFKQYWNAGVDATVSTARLGMANSIAGIIVAVLAPVLGAIADRGSSRKKFLFFFAYMGVIMSSLLYMVSEGNWLLATALYILATIGFNGGNIFYDSLIVMVTSEKKFDIVSSVGFAFGYLGGGLLFALNVWMALSPAAFGFENPQDAVRFSFLTVGIWWAVFSIPVFLFVKETEGREPKPESGVVLSGFRQLRDTFREIRHLKMIFTFLAAYWFYIDGVDTVIHMAVDYGISIGFHANDLIVALLITQFVGFPCAVGFGYLGEKLGAKQAVFIAIGVYLFVSVWGAFMRDKNEFYILAVVIGFVQGGIQALSRSLYAKIIPPNKSAEYFGFYNMLGKFAAVMGPALMGGVALMMRSAGYSIETAARASLISISALFIIGGILLHFVDVQKGREEARYLSQK